MIIDDNYFEDIYSSDIVDLAVGMGAKYLNIQGLGVPEKVTKVMRYHQIFTEICPKGEEPEEVVKETAPEGEAPQNE